MKVCESSLRTNLLSSDFESFLKTSSSHLFFRKVVEEIRFIVTSSIYLCITLVIQPIHFQRMLGSPTYSSDKYAL